jgi:hypothetical protein
VKGENDRERRDEINLVPESNREKSSDREEIERYVMT